MINNKSIDYIFGMITGSSLMLAFWACTSNDLVASSGTVQRELGHKSTEMTQRYLRFPEQRRLDDFPNLREYIEQRQNIPKNSIRATDLRATLYSNISKLHSSQ